MDDKQDQTAPEGAVCAQHPERPAAFTCPRCGNYACVFCFHPVAERCEACLTRDPAAAAPPIPWETPDAPVLLRYFETLGTAFSPTRTAPAFAAEAVRPALTFFLLSALPFALLAGIIPFTRLLRFGGSFAVTIVGQPGEAELVLDVGLAMLTQLGLLAVDFACLTLPFTSLVRAYAPEPRRRTAALRVMLYRSWLPQAAALLYFFALWALPAGQNPEEPPAHFAAVVLVRFFLTALLVIAMRATARLACGLRPLLSYVVVAVPLVLWSIVADLATRLVTPIVSAAP